MSTCRRSTRGCYTTVPPAQRFVFVRNPYYHRIDEKGQQLPYIDDVIMTVAATNLVPAKAGLGEADLQPRYLNMRDYTFLQKSAKTSGVNVRLWESGSGSQIALYPNLNADDEEWRKLMRDVRFRRALSLAIDREELNQVVYLGLAKPSNNTIMERSELFKPEYATKWAQYDPKLANKLLDEVGLNKRGSDGIRLLPDGRPATIVVEHASEETEDADALHLIAEYWKKIGIKMLTKPQTRENFRLRAFSGEAIMTAYAGVVTAVPTPDTSPKEFAPTMQGGLQWSRWGMFVESKGKQGEKCDMQVGLQAPRLRQGVGDRDRRRRCAARPGTKILPANADEVFSIGTVNGIRQPIVVGPKVRNVPKEGYYRHHDRLRRRRDGRADGQHQPQGVRADHAGRPSMVPLGHVCGVQGHERRGMRHAVGLQADRLPQGVGDLGRPRGAPQGLGRDPDRQRRRGLLDRHGKRDLPTHRRWTENPQRAQGRLLRLGSGRIHRALSARHVLDRPVGSSRCQSASARITQDAP